MKTLKEYDYRYSLKIWKLNFALIPFYITISLTAHIIAMRLSEVFGYPIISAAWIYMAVFVLNDVVRSYSRSRTIVYVFILLEALCNFLSFLYCNIIAHSNAPAYVGDIGAYKLVFGSVWPIYLANLAGSALAALLDVWLFAYLFFKRKLPFFFASLLSSITTLVIYTVITDYFGMVGTFPNHIWIITGVNVITNIIMLTFYSILGQIFIWWISRFYLNRL